MFVQYVNEMDLIMVRGDWQHYTSHWLFIIFVISVKVISTAKLWAHATISMKKPTVGGLDRRWLFLDR